MTIQLYVGTYEKYNNGSIAGAWIDLEGHDRESFYEACKELHKDEQDPEFMFQDFEGFPRDLYEESNASEALFDWLALGEDDRDLLAAYGELVGSQYATLENAQEAFSGKQSEEDFAYALVNETMEVPEHIQSYFDYDKFQRDLFMTDYSSVEYNDETYIFRNL